jgi:CRISPR-associated protein Csd1
MILERLIELRDRLLDDPESELTPAYHKRQKIKWVMDISKEGTFTGFVTTGQKKADYKEFNTPYKMRQGTRSDPLLLVDKRDYVLGPQDVVDKKSSKANVNHKSYLDLISECSIKSDHDALRAYVAFLSNDIEKRKARLSADSNKIKEGELILPRIDGVIPSTVSMIRRFWQERQDNIATNKNTLQADCMVCGQRKSIARIHSEVLIGQDRPQLVSGNSKAFRSYNLVQSEIAPMCQGCADAYVEALSWLLRATDHHLRINDITWVFWTRNEVGFDIMRILNDPKIDDVHQLLRSPFTGSDSAIDDSAFYALALSSNVKRLIVRNWLTVSVAEVLRNIGRFFDCQRIVGLNGKDDPIKLKTLAMATVRDEKGIPPHLVPALIDNALRGIPLPLQLLQLAVARARAEREHVMTRPRAALIKMILLSQPDFSEDIMPELNPNNPHPAYHCGRLLALLDDIQKNAVGARATLVDRYYGAASSTPAVVFGSLMRNAQNHLGKLRKTRPRLYVHFDRLIGDIASHIDAFPTMLTLREQGLFALGFYQQRIRPRGKEQSEDSTIEGLDTNESED